MPEASQILTPFGFTGLESEIYAFLLKESPATGYRVAQAIGKAAANTYKAIESLQQKGAVLVEEGASRACRAVPSDELLARLTRDFEWRRAEAEILLSRINSDSTDDRVYTLRSRDQIVERARHMLGAAQAVALGACSTAMGHHLSDSFASCARRGVEVMVSCPEHLDIKIKQKLTSHSLEELRLVTDGCQSLSALFIPGREEAVQAIWTQSSYLSVCAHRGLAAELSQLGLKPTPFERTLGYVQLV